MTIRPPPPARPVYVVRLRPAPGCRVPGEVALRRLLKAMGRAYGLRCLGVRERRQKATAAAKEQRC